MKVLLTGSAGQLGQALLASKPEHVDLILTSRAGGHNQIALDLADSDACRDIVREYRPDWVLNAGAYTAVDQAESEPDMAYAVNAGAPRAFGEALLETDGRLLQLSTDFVFNGQQGCPYRVEQSRDPLGIYGQSKAEGEAAVEQLLVGSGKGTILRTSWVYGPAGRNFLLTMIRLHREQKQLKVVSDQVGCPTSTCSLAMACWTLVDWDSKAYLPSWLHWSDAGVASWYDFAVAIGELAYSRGVIERAAEVIPITSAEYPTAAQRPSYSLLDCTDTRQGLGLSAEHWRHALESVIADVEI